MNPAFELDQIHRYIDHLAADPRQLGATADSHFFPVLQRIFFREGFEVAKERELRDRSFAFVLKDLNLKKPLVAVDFAYQRERASSLVPGYAFTWKVHVSEEPPAALLILRNSAGDARMLKQLSETNPSVRFLDFDALKQYATTVFHESEKRERMRVAAIVTDMLEALIAAVAAEEFSLEDIQWFDLERLFHQTLKGLGYYAHLTPSTKDGGRDVLACDILIDDVHWYAVEIKHWRSSKPGAQEVGSFLETSLREGRHGALFLSTSGVSKKALELRTEVHSDYLKFGDGRQLVQSCKHYVRAKSGLWEPHATLRSFLFEGAL